MGAHGGFPKVFFNNHDSQPNTHGNGYINIKAQPNQHSPTQSQCVPITEARFMISPRTFQREQLPWYGQTETVNFHGTARLKRS